MQSFHLFRKPSRSYLISVSTEHFSPLAARVQGSSFLFHWRQASKLFEHWFHDEDSFRNEDNSWRKCCEGVDGNIKRTKNPHVYIGDYTDSLLLWDEPHFGLDFLLDRLKSSLLQRQVLFKKNAFVTTHWFCHRLLFPKMRRLLLMKDPSFSWRHPIFPLPLLLEDVGGRVDVGLWMIMRDSTHFATGLLPVNIFLQSHTGW